MNRNRIENPRQVDLKIVVPHLNIGAIREAGVAAWFREQADQLSGADRNRYLTLAAKHETSAAEAQKTVQVGVAAIGSAFAKTNIEITRCGQTTVVKPSFQAASLPGDQRGTLGMARVGRQVDSQLIPRVAIEAAEDKVGNLPAAADKYFRGYNGPTLGDMVQRAMYVLTHLGKTPEDTNAEHNTKIQQIAAGLRDQLAKRADTVRLQSVKSAGVAPISPHDYAQLSAAPSDPRSDVSQDFQDSIIFFAQVAADVQQCSWRVGGIQYTETVYLDGTPSLSGILDSPNL